MLTCTQEKIKLKNLQFLEGGQPPYKRKRYAVYPVGWLPEGKGDDFNVEVFYSEDQDETLEKSTNLVVIFNQYVTCMFYLGIKATDRLCRQ